MSILERTLTRNVALVHSRKLNTMRHKALSIVAVLTVLILAFASPAYAANPAALQTYYITLPEPDALTVLDAIETTADAPMYTYFSIAIVLDDTYVYYDQWEDGYASDIANPTSGEIYNASSNPGGVQIWGNGEADDGCAPNISGTPVTCTDGNDVLNAGDVVIPYNVIAVPRVSSAQSNVLDNFAVVSYSNNNGNTNWSSDWADWDTTTTTGNYRDEFGAQAYNNSDGTINWTSSWIEEGDGTTSPSSGTIYINTTADALRFRYNSTVNDAIRRTADLSGYTGATFSFTLDGVSVDSTDDIRVQVSGDGGANWATLQTFESDPNGATFSYDISSYIASNTTIRFIMVNTLEDENNGDNEYWQIDNVNIAVTSPAGSSSTGPSAGTVQVTSGQLRFTAASANDRIDRGVSLPTGDPCATLSFTLGQSGIDATGDNFAVQVSSDGGSNYTTLATFTSSADAGAKSYPISAYATANTRVRFISLDALEAGEYWSVDDVQVAWNCSYPILFDARDKVGASNPVSMARAVWADGSGTLNAFAHEMYPTSEWGTEYEAPVGSNTADPGTSMFQYSALTIMATLPGTQVQIDANADGTYETTVTLNEGGTYLATGTLQGARVQADQPIQVVLLTGDIDDTYESRDINLLPVSAYGSSYWSPVGVMWNLNPTRLWLYNPSTNGQIYITCERYGASNTTLGPVSARGIVTLDLAAGQGARCFASTSGGVETTDPIFGIGTIDTGTGDGGGDDGSRSDWSFVMFPDNFLTTEVLVGLGLGKDPTENASTENGSPVWVTTTCDTYVYVDWNNDGTPDLVDTDGDDVGETGSQNGILVNRLQSVRLFEPGADEEEYDQSGARVWTRTASGVGYGGTPGCKIAAAWGQDPNNATAGTPGLDVGTSVPPLRLVLSAKSLALKYDNDNDGQLSQGDQAVYTIIVRNIGPTDVDDVYVYDTVPPNTTYVISTTQAITSTLLGWFEIPDDPNGDHYPLDDTTDPPPNGVFISDDMATGQTYTVTFDIILGAGDNYELILNCNTAFTEGGIVGACATSYVATGDWGDLPDSYGTTLSSDGPRHSSSGLTLGTWLDLDQQGQPDPNADGDDANETTNPQDDDEDGVSVAGTAAEWNAGNGAFNVVVAGGSGCLNAWMDFTNDAGAGAGTPFADGNFTKTGGYDTYLTYSEHIFQNLLVNAGTTLITATIPPGLFSPATNSYYFRFRLSPTVDGVCTASIAPTGFVSGGEVEDYKFDANPTAVTVLPLNALGTHSAIVLIWETVNEISNLGFNVYRATSVSGPKIKLNAEMIPSLIPPGSPFGAKYEYVDETAKAGKVYYYWLEDVDIFGRTGLHGPVKASWLPLK